MTARTRSVLLLAASLLLAVPTAYGLIIASIGYCYEDASDPERSCSGLSPEIPIAVTAPLALAGTLMQVWAVVRGEEGRDLASLGAVIVGASYVLAWAYLVGRTIYLNG